MRRNIVFALFVLVLASLYVHGQQRSAKETQYKSPDGSLVAIVRSVNQPEATDESEVRVQTASGKVLARRNYRSEDGEHGHGVTKAQWTPDSQFFVYSLESSVGHQAWHSPVQYFGRRSGRIASLDDALNDAVMNPQFSVEAPDKVTVDLYFGKKTSTVSLSSLGKKDSSTR
jgi:dipeptidyl aminopeptidase/acylaminoacyl peptidase